MDDDAFRRLLDHLSLSWNGYRKVRKGVKKRLRRHMQALGCRTLSEYLARLDRESEVRAACHRNLTVTISRFFRDRGLWHALEAFLLPEMMNRFPAKLRVWSAGCACGEEPYSFAIVWERLQKRFGRGPVLELLATDQSDGSLVRAQAGRYPLSSLREVPPNLRSECFDARKHEKQFQIRPHLKQGVVFRRHDFLSEAPPGRFHLIFLRNNLLTYYQDHITIPAFERIVGTLAPNGLLIVGAHEKVPPGIGRLVPDARFDRVWRAVT
jgi:chemotaxis protein methyltransferase CheR